jgi:shikimate dehydrogenase
MAKQFAVLGSPISHSLSPVIHTAAYKSLGFNWLYERFEVSKADLGKFLRSTGKPFDGFSVTMPLKKEALRLSDWHHAHCVTTGLANTLLKTDDGVKAFNTDIFGLEMALQLPAIKPKHVVVLGTGATAKSLLVALSKVHPKAQISIWGRRRSEVDRLLSFGIGLDLIIREFESSQDVDLMISTLPSSSFENSIPELASVSTHTFLDVAYNPWPSNGSKFSSERSSEQISGIHMLIWQAIGQIRIFNFGSFEVELENEIDLSKVMNEAANAALK